MRGLLSVFILISFFIVSIGCDLLKAQEFQSIAFACDSGSPIHTDDAHSQNEDAENTHCQMHCAHSTLLTIDVVLIDDRTTNKVTDLDLYRFLYESPSLETPERPPLKV